MTTVYNHISHSAKCHNIKHVSCIFTCINKTESLYFLHIKNTYSNINQIEGISPYRTPYEVVYFISLHNMVLKYAIHFNRISNYIIHSFNVLMGSFA